MAAERQIAKSALAKLQELVGIRRKGAEPSMGAKPNPQS